MSLGIGRSCEVIGRVAIIAILSLAAYHKTRYVFGGEATNATIVLSSPTAAGAATLVDSTIIVLLLAGWRRAGYCGAMIVALGGTLFTAYARVRLGTEATCGCFGTSSIGKDIVLLSTVLGGASVVGLWAEGGTHRTARTALEHGARR